MTVLGPTAFALVLWGTLLAVFGVFVYEVYAIGVEYGWLGGPARDGPGPNRGGGE